MHRSSIAAGSRLPAPHRTRSGRSIRLVRCAALAAPILATVLAGAPFLASSTHAQGCTGDPVASGVNVSPSNGFSVQEYAFAHSSTNLQGFPATRKVAAGLFWNPAGAFGTGTPRAYGAFSSAVIVNNPDPNNDTNVAITYRDPDGVVLGTPTIVSIPADGTFIEDARKIGLGAAGIGTATIEVVDPENDAPIVGATLHYFDSIAVPGWGVARDPDAIVNPVNGQLIPGPGEGSYQQLQAVPAVEKGDYAGWLFAGPFRFSNVSSSDFDNGSAPILSIANPNDHDVPVAIVIAAVGPNGFVADIGTRIATIKANGMMLDDWLWNGCNRLSANFTGNYHFEFLTAVIALDGSPLVGDALVIDAFADNQNGLGNRNLNLGGRLRMVSSALPTGPGKTYNGTLLASDVSTFTPTGGTSPMIRTVIHVANAALAPTGPITIEYFDHAGNLAGIDSVASLAPAATLQIGRGESQTPNFPQNMWNGSVRIQGQCAGERLIGWTHREIGKAPSSWPANYQYYKAYGEELTGANDMEPGIVGPVYSATYNGSETFISRRVAPLVRTWAFSTPPYWPGYTTFANGFALDDTRTHFYRFMELSGLDATSYSAYQARPLTGLRFGASSLTYEDTDPAPMLPLSLLNASQGNGSARVDFTETINLSHGINVLGDPFPEFLIGQFARKNLGPSGSSRPKPIDPAVDATEGEDPGVPWSDATDASQQQ